MSALRAIGSGIGCAVFAGLGAFVGSEIGAMKSHGNANSTVGGAILGAAGGALLVGALTGATSNKPVINVSGSGLAGLLSGVPRCRNPRWP
jgi:hypothetical protein